MKLITYASPTHLAMCKEFVLDRSKAAGFGDVVLYEDVHQLSETGNHNTKGFNDHCYRKLQAMIDQEIGNSIVYLDADCTIYPGFADWCYKWFDSAEPNQIGHGHDDGDYCMGVVLFSQTEETRRWLQFVKEYSWHRGLNDQGGHLELRRNCIQFRTSCVHLDRSVVSNVRCLDDVGSVLCFHANYCVGVEAKVSMLRQVDLQASAMV